MTQSVFVQAEMNWRWLKDFHTERCVVLAPHGIMWCFCIAGIIAVFVVSNYSYTLQFREGNRRNWMFCLMCIFGRPCLDGAVAKETVCSQSYQERFYG